MPIIIGEFGIPSSRGLSKISVHNWNKGLNSEEEQGNILTKMYEDIIYQGALGGIISNWQDDWFGNPWSNVQDPKQHLGLLSFRSDKVIIDGSKKKIGIKLNLNLYINRRKKR